MKSIAVHVGVLMTLLTIIYGLWQNYEYDYLIIKTIEVFLIWMIAAYIFQFILRLIIPPQKMESEEVMYKYSSMIAGVYAWIFISKDVPKEILEKTKLLSTEILGLDTDRGDTLSIETYYKNVSLFFPVY